MSWDGLPAWAGKTLFGIVAVLLVLGGWFVMSGANHVTNVPIQELKTIAPSNVPAPSNPQPVQPVSTSPATPSNGTPSPTTESSATTQLGNLAMPISQKVLAGSAGLAVNVITLVNTYRWDEDPGVRAGKLRPLVSGDAVTTVSQSAPTGKVAEQFVAEKTSTTATARVAKVRLVAVGQVMFEVAVTQTAVTTKGRQMSNASYWVSVNTDANQVTSVQPAGTGN